MRISKEPEERKQEILDTAMKLFSENGFEKTSISDIAKEIGVAQGLCYRYFPSKDILFQSAINQYAQLLVDRMLEGMSNQKKSFKDMIKTMPIILESENDIYYSALHDSRNSTFHKLLSLSLCEKIVPIVTDILNKAIHDNEIAISNVETYATFCVYGQLGILMDETLKQEEKVIKIRTFIKELFD